MTNSAPREVVLGVTGSIAAYKAAEIASQLVQRGIKVTPVLTTAACELVCPATFEAITGNKAITRLFEPLSNPEIEHIAVANRADLFLIAPATANILAKAAVGIADDWLSTTLLATRAPVLFAPAMNTLMYEHPATQENLRILKQRGCHFIGPESGRLACGTVGAGRMADPSHIVEFALTLLDPRNDLRNVRVLITSGPTREPIDPVRFISNRSSGKMGTALAREALFRKAHVTVISGPSEVAMPYGVEVLYVETAEEMAQACATRFSECDVFIAAAAVADYKPDHVLDTKHKRSDGPLRLSLVENPDILGTLAQRKAPHQIIVGFAAETDNLLAHAREKLTKKNLDFLLANQIGIPQSGFGTSTVRAYLLHASGETADLGLLPKETVAERIFDRVAELIKKRTATQGASSL
ncbi:MAG TPA: bifunctional phosphopantothenoylcysteine decarboxylase/phosphopantothenate--cysteine ligase CoaBC [Candidatus Hydrogenedentes bacterium]|nr:bifunctional phosphopantothenoylcysteine decarboxylase/phosphopantothenate--cysteine ligase CoaBC [Candidatus Hydrogenedentota bacterium]HOL78136.1 bifunctional phosphopantothenoylcysteine decarboxylase/phosphopantothenate--cysteine ligase CoaBC [Candidatus Hydrogenedentota bacterium]HPO85575.1 bifunctional phosphopantothenoylcysteine decarboxylase/phosphopantothenate--cysteine ligase CoaBC [Candidatus Hydrogenedentota bacterium]